jgi:NitT/TauT family transport system substrate-binding protein
MEQAIVSGQVDAGFMIEPWVTRAKDGTALRILDPPGPWGYVADRFMIASWFAKKSWADQNKDTADRFVRAILKAHRFSAENEREARQIFAKAINLDEAVALKMVVPLWPERWSKTDLEPVIAAAVREKMVDKTVPAEQMVLPSAGMSR